MIPSRLSATVSAVTLSILAAGAAIAADLPSRRAPAAYVAVPVPPAFSWTGFYAGTTSGYAFSDDSQSILRSGGRPALRSTQSGFMGFGGGVGYDYQLTPGSGLVFGVATDAALMGLDRRRGYAGGPQASNGFAPELVGYRQQLDWMGTVRGRVGYAFDRVLVYGTGGFAYGGVNYQAASLRTTDGALTYAGRYNDTATGFVYGGGVEYAIPAGSLLSKFSLLNYLDLFKYDSMTLKVEYLRYDLGNRNVAVNPVAGGPAGAYTSRFSTEGNIVRAGFSYRFGTY